MTRPAPLTPADLDLRSFPYMALDLVRLRDSRFAVVATAEEFRAGVLLWAAAYHQVPAASLPNDNRLLANLAGFGRNIDDWLAVRDGALYGFIECEDGRLYHPVVAEKALAAEKTRCAFREKTANATEARRASRKRDAERDVDRDDHRDGAHHGHRDVHEGKGKEEKGDEGKRSNQAETAVVVSSATVKMSEKPAGPTTTTKAIGQVLGRKNPLGTALPEGWTPNEYDQAVAASFGMDAAVVEEQLLQFHAYNASRGTFSPDWSAIWFRWCSAWKRKQSKEAPPVQLSAAVTITDAIWQSAANIWAKEQRWSRQLGNEPGMGGCRCPPEILIEHGIDPATGIIKAMASTPSCPQ